MSKVKSKARQLNMLLFNELYEFKPGHNRLRCVYCNDVRECLDHIPPISLLGRYGSKRFREDGIQFYKMPCCNACNKVLSNRPLYTYEERLGYLYSHLLKKISNHSIWQREELNTLTGELKRMITARQKYFHSDTVDRFRFVELKLNQLNK